MRHDRNLLAASVCINFACSLTASAAFAVLPLEEEARLHLGRWHLGSILGSLSLAYAPACLCSGALATRVGCKRLALGGIFVTAASAAAFGLAEQPASLYAARMAQGVGTAAGEVGIMALVAVRCHEDVVGRITALLEVAHGVGWAVGPPLAGLLYQSFGFAATFAACAGLCVLAGGVSALVLAAVPDAAQAEEPPSLKTVARAGPGVLPTVLVTVVFFAAQDLLFANITARVPRLAPTFERFPFFWGFFWFPALRLPFTSFTSYAGWRALAFVLIAR